MKKKALILGVGGQDGSYLADILLERNYEVSGVYRRSSVDNLIRVSHLKDKMALLQGDITDPTSIQSILGFINPDEIYNVADQDHVGWSYSIPSYSFDVTAKAVAVLLDLAWNNNRNVSFYQACSATMFGGAPPKQTEDTQPDPQSPYAIAKTAAYHTARYYRNVLSMRVTTAILYNHDSPRRQGDYLLHQICRQALDVARGKSSTITVGNPEMVVNIGHAREYMEGVVNLLQLHKADDYILSSGDSRSIRSAIDLVMNLLGVTKYKIVANSSLLRPGKQPQLIGDNTKAQKAIGFRPKRWVGLLSEILSQERQR